MAQIPDDRDPQPPVVNLSDAPGERETWGRSVLQVYLWAVCELLLVTNPWQISSRIRAAALRAFGASIGKDVILRPRLRVRFPWKLKIGDRSWIGEGVWIHNQDRVDIGSDVVFSQETMLTTGSHAHKRDMALLTRPIEISDGAWITSRCFITGGVALGTSSLVTPMSVVRQSFPPNSVVTGNPAVLVGQRFATEGLL